MVCGLCWQRLVELPWPQCTRCGHPRRGGSDACYWCSLIPTCVHRVRSLCWASDRIGQRLVHALKYEGWHKLGVEMGARLVRPCRELAGDRPLALVPVPLAAQRLRERGYNQCEAIAKGLARNLGGTIVTGVLQRIRETPTQTRLTPEQRLHNVASAFHVDAGRAAKLQDAVCILIDDVITTGATMNACAAALADAGVGTICYLTFGRARDPRDSAPTTPETPHGHSRRH